VFVTSLKFKRFICVLIVVVIFESNQIPMFYLNSIENSNSDLYLNFNSNSVVIELK
jgi:hypothetical protein